MADVAGPFEPDRAHVYGLAERRAQLRRFMNACEQVSRSFAEGHWPGADEYASLAEIATDCLRHPIEPERLKALATALPPKPSWMDPRMAGYNGFRQPWQDAAAVARTEADQAALEMRAFATYDRP